jgi:hypothetical protein
MNIGELLQSGLLGGAQLYNQQASRRQQGEIANRELDQREAIRNDRLIEAEFQRQQQMEAAQRMLDQEAADGAIFSAIRSLGQPTMGPNQPGTPPPDPFAGIDGVTVGRASPRAQDAYARFALNREGSLKTRERLLRKYEFLKGLNLNKHLSEKDFWEMVDNGIEFEEDQIPHIIADQMEAGQTNIRDAWLTSLGQTMRPEELNPYLAMRPRVFNSQFAKPLQAESMRRLREADQAREKEAEQQAAVQAETQEAQRFAAATGMMVEEALFLGKDGRKQVIFDKVRSRPDTVTDDQIRFVVDSAADRLKFARDAFLKTNTNEKGEPLGWLAPTPEEIKRAAQPMDPPGLGNAMGEPEYQKLRARVESYAELVKAIEEQKAANEAVKVLADRSRQATGLRTGPRSGASLPFGGGGSDFAPAPQPGGPALPEDQSIDEMINRGASNAEIEAAMNRGVQ